MRYDLTVTTTRSEEVCQVGWTLTDDEGGTVLVGTQMGECLDVHSVETAFVLALEHLWANLSRSGGVQGSFLTGDSLETPMSTRSF